MFHVNFKAIFKGCMYQPGKALPHVKSLPSRMREQPVAEAWRGGHAPARANELCHFMNIKAENSGNELGLKSTISSGALLLPLPVRQKEKGKYPDR